MNAEIAVLFCLACVILNTWVVITQAREILALRSSAPFVFTLFVFTLFGWMLSYAGLILALIGLAISQVRGS